MIRILMTMMMIVMLNSFSDDADNVIGGIWWTTTSLSWVPFRMPLFLVQILIEMQVGA